MTTRPVYQQSKGALDGRLMLAGCPAFYAMANLSGWLAPQIVFGTTERFAVSSSAAGMPTLIEGVTTGLLSIALGARPPRVGFRNLSLAASCVYLAINGLTPLLHSYPALLGARFIAGIANACLIYVTVSLVASTSKNPDRSFAALNIVGSVYGATLVASLPILSPASQGLTYLPYAAITGGILSFLVFFMPQHAVPAAHPEHVHGSERLADDGAARVFLMLILVILPVCMQSFSVFSFSTSLGMRLGMNEAAINTALGIATLISIAGPFCAAWSARHFGRWPSLAGIAILLSVANVTLLSTGSSLVFRICVAANLTAAYFLNSLLMAWCAELDPQGRYSSIITGGLAASASISPVIAGTVIGYAGLDGLRPFVITLSVLFGIPILLLKLRRVRAI